MSSSPLTCPRCETSVPTEALYCPYCNLPRPKTGFLTPVEDKPEETTPVPQHAVVYATPVNSPSRNVRSSTTINRAAHKPPSPFDNRSFRRPEKPRKRLRTSVLISAALLPLVAVSVYIFVVPM